MLSKWLLWKAPTPAPYKNFALIEIDEQTQISQEVKGYLMQVLQDARIDTDFLKTAVSHLGWDKVQTLLLDQRLPSAPKLRCGFFGEVLTSALLTEFSGYVIPVQKLRFAITPNQSLPGTDVLAIKKEGEIVSEICFVESKLRNTKDASAAVTGYRQLKEDHMKKVPDIISFVLSRLYEMKDPLLYGFLNYLQDRSDTTEKESFRLGLIWENEAWAETVLQNLEEEVKPVDSPHLIVQRVRIQRLAPLIEELFKAMGAAMVLEDD